MARTFPSLIVKTGCCGDPRNIYSVLGWEVDGSRQCHRSWLGMGHSQDVWEVLTSLEGLRRMSPTPPPFLSPWFMTVTIHMRRVSQARSVLSSSSSSAGGQYVRTWGYPSCPTQLTPPTPSCRPQSLTF